MHIGGNKRRELVEIVGDGIDKGSKPSLSVQSHEDAESLRLLSNIRRMQNMSQIWASIQQPLSSSTQLTRIYMKIFILCNQCLRAFCTFCKASVESFDLKKCLMTFLGITKHERHLMHLGITIRKQRWWRGETNSKSNN
ncbi:uncharacterized protein LOC116022380 isoform X2 [Ipomoea triloba]|uniref:uncharacterized protein LOC116022380 isoform X2 n=1 Tax=Ipomoea triloba TaxID=35885 RepID=UPI00125D2A06|nr:uncharacterized protein LOC116022380 isoform X2 [Ipomoea triloba]